MKHFTFKWLKRLWALIAVKLLLLAIIITAVRIIIVSVNDYKEAIVEWIADEHNIQVKISNISAGFDFSGIVLTLKDVSFVNDPTMPFDLNLDHLFLHLDFLNSYHAQKAVFNDISIKGADLTIKPFYHFDQSSSKESHVTLDSLKSIFLSRLNSFSIKNSTVRFTDHLAHKKSIYIEDLSWLNSDLKHQGVGKASLPDTLGENTLEFIIDISGDPEGPNDQLLGSIYTHAENLNATEYLKPQVNPLAEVKSAVISFKSWMQFDFNGPRSALLEWGDSQMSWALLGQSHNWKINAGQMQMSYQQRQWVFDSYDLNILHNFVPWSDVQFSGSGIYGQYGEFDFNGVNLNRLSPFALLFSGFDEPSLKRMMALELGGEIKHINVTRHKQDRFLLSADIEGFNNQAYGAIPGVSNADISFSADQQQGWARVTLPKQELYFDGQFSRAMPIQQGEVILDWSNAKQGFTIQSDHTLLKSDDLNTFTQFSLLFPTKNSSPFLSLYTYADLNDAHATQYYLPIKAMGKDVFNYLQPTLQKGTVTGAQILWYGAFSDYPYQQKNGIFQAWVPLKDTQYDFYGEWQGLTEMDLDLLFENDYLLMESTKAKLGKASVEQLSAKIDVLGQQGILSIDAHLNEEGQYISEYLINSPLKDSVGNALKTIRIHKPITGQLSLTIPFNDQAHVKGTIDLLGNDIDIDLAKDLLLPLKNVNGSFSFDDGALRSDGLHALFSGQPVQMAFSTEQLASKYQLNADLSGHWNIDQVNQAHPKLKPLQLSGELDWQGKLDFVHRLTGGYQFELDLSSPLQGLSTDLPAPYIKNALHSWPTTVNIKGSEDITKWDLRVDNKLRLLGALDYQQQQLSMPYFFLGLGESDAYVDYKKQVVRVNLFSINFAEWATYFKECQTNLDINNAAVQSNAKLFSLDDIYLDIKQLYLFEQPLVNFHSEINLQPKQWNVAINSQEFESNIEFRKGTPDRYDININKLDFQLFNKQAFKDFYAKPDDMLAQQPSDNLREQYPEVLFECKECNFNSMHLSPLTIHAFPTKLRYNIEQFKLGGEEEFVNISGVWDQRRTNIVIDALANENNGIVRRLNYQSPMVFEKAELSGALNWIGAPWEFNFDSLNGAFSTDVDNGLITEVDDKGARLLSFLSLDGVRRSLNLEFGNVFSKGWAFDKISMSANINNGILISDDYSMEGSAGKVTGKGKIDLPNSNVNYQFSYSPAVTSSLPVLAAFAINPLTGAAVLMATKILEPVVDTIIRVDFSVKGAMNDPEVKIENSQRGRVELRNSEVLEEMEEAQKQNQLPQEQIEQQSKDQAQPSELEQELDKLAPTQPESESAALQATVNENIVSGAQSTQNVHDNAQSNEVMETQVINTQAGSSAEKTQHPETEEVFDEL